MAHHATYDMVKAKRLFRLLLIRTSPGATIRFMTMGERKVKYRISDVARVLGLTPGALHYFEREKIVTIKKEANGYRYYDIDDIFRLLSYEKYRSMGYPLKSVLQQFTYETDNRESIIERVRLRYEEALAQAEYYAQLASAIGEHLKGNLRIDSLLGRYALTQMPDTLLLHDEECGWISKNKQAQYVAQKWVKAMPLTRLSVLLPMREDTEQPPAGVLCYSVAAEHARVLHLPLELQVTQLPASLCLHTIVHTDEGFLDDPACIFTDLLQEVKRRGLTRNGMPWGTILLVEIRPDGGLRPFLELWAPVK